MQSLYFWKNWIKDYRYLWYGMAGLFLLSLLFLWFSYFQGVDGVIHWEKLQEQKALQTIVHTYRLGPFQLEVPADTYIIFEYFNGSDVFPNTTASYFFLIVLAVCATVLLTVITTMEKFWYFVAMGLFILFIVSLRFEVLGLFGQANRIPVGAVLLLYVTCSFYFNRFASSTPFVIRLVVFAFITIAIALVINFLSSVPIPFYHLTLTGYTAGLVLSVLFMLMVAHEILASFVYIVSQGSTKNLQHLSIITAVYLANLLITCLHEMGTIQWNFIYVNLFLLLTISALLGIWGFRQRENIYGNILSFHPFGSYFYLAMGAICFVTIGQLLGNANDPAVKIMRDMIIFSHTGYGIIFALYLFSNFVLMLAHNLPIHKVLYNPTRMPYFTYRFAGLIVMLAFVFLSNWHEYVYHGLSGFYNTAGDMYRLIGNEKYAESFYEQGRNQGFENHRSNYALGAIKGSHFNFEGAHRNYQLANGKRPSEYSLTNAGNVYLWETETFSAIKTYKHSLEIMPGSGILNNNLGYAYIRVHNLDSALLSFNTALEKDVSKNSAQTNFFGMAAAELLPLHADSILNIFGNTSPATISNAIALATVTNTPFSTPVSPLTEKPLNLYSATLLNNYIIKNLKTLDTTFITQAYRIASDSLNEDYNEAIKSSLAFAYYHQGNISKALEILGELAFISSSYQGTFNFTMGLWALEQNNPTLAASYFKFAQAHEHKDAVFYHAIALTEAGKVPEALEAWDSVSLQKNEAEREIALNLKRILTTSPAQALTLTDPDKYQFCRYRIGIRDTVLFNTIVNKFENANYKAQALLDLSRKFFESDMIIPAISYYRKIAGLTLTDERLYNEVRHFELLMLAYRNEVRALANQINNNITFDSQQSLEKLLYTALINEVSGEVATAKKQYKILGSYNPYFEEGIIAAANFFRKENKNDLHAYTVLAEALQINANSKRLLHAYINEALRKGFDDYAASATERLKTLD